MTDDRPEADVPGVPARSDQDPRTGVANQVAGIAAPLAQLGFETVQDIASVVRSTGTAGRDFLRLVNVFDRVRRVDWSGESGTLPLALEAQPSSGVFTRVAEAALRPPSMINAAVAPVRRAVAESIGFGGGGDFGRGNGATLREQGDLLIKESLDPDGAFVLQHPAFARILAELTPDEARIVRFLAVAGPQPAIDIRTKTLFQIGSERLAFGVNMIAEMAGCQWAEASQSYLANLNRLGLVRFSSEPVEDYRRYSLLEVQPRAVEAIEAADRSTISVYRSIYLGSFGQRFCEVCIDTEGYGAGGWDVNERGDKIVGRRRSEDSA